MPTAVLLHGTGDSPKAWDLVRKELGSDWHVLRPPPEELRKTLLPPGKLTLVGHSYGGWEAVRWAAKKPERIEKLVLVEPVLFGLLAGYDEAALEAVRSASSPFSLRALLDFWGGPGTWDALPMQQQYRLMAEEPRIRRQVARVERLPIEVEEFAALDVPTIVVCGTETAAAAQRLCLRLTELMPNARLEILEDAGHDSPRSHPRALSDLIRS